MTDDNAFKDGFAPKCASCGCDRIWWDAVADWKGNLVSVFDHHECSDCGGKELVWERED